MAKGTAASTDSAAAVRKRGASVPQRRVAVAIGRLPILGSSVRPNAGIDAHIASRMPHVMATARSAQSMIFPVMERCLAS
jgi:hypothetical protein